ncbi:MAG: 1-acyl-sn-glycerol-3-phosphate acyltransferase [Oscillospiraceae bacterium]|jgi:1-acyl-sn-glycerol-3-phosphate acyltransferase|nr:1-acyl-sn-glycerol-3-phosphate acyltransferase [Oscillospiraceae bacterium]
MEIKKPNALIYFLIYIFFYPLLKILFRLEVDRSGYTPFKGAGIIVSNHSSFMDFLIVMLSLYPQRTNAVTAQKFFLYKPLHKLLPMVGCIPKNLFEPDVRPIIGIKSVLKRGDKVLLFPEGRCATDGVYAGMHKSTGKLIKKLGVPVVGCYVEGAYRCMPFWRDGFRTGRTRITISNLLSHDELESLSIDEVNESLDKWLSGNSSPPSKRPLYTFGTRRLAEGLEKILYWCPKCNQEFTMVTKGCIIACTACENEAKLDRYMLFEPTSGSIAPVDIHTWYKEQAHYEARQLHEDMKPLCVRVDVRLPSDIPGRGMVTCGFGTISLDPKGWRYKGELKGEQVDLFFPIDTVPALPIDPNDVFQIYAHGTFYMFATENRLECAKYSLIGECAYWKFASNVQMTECAIFNVSGGLFA